MKNNKEEIKIRIILIIIGFFFGFILGLAANYLWYVFHALILGWRDSAPEWYFKIQDTVDTVIMSISIFVGIVGLHLLYNRAQKKRKGEAQQNFPADR